MSRPPCTCRVGRIDLECPLGLEVGNHPIGGASEEHLRAATLEGLSALLKLLKKRGTSPHLSNLLGDAHDLLKVDTQRIYHKGFHDPEIPF